MNAKRQPYHRQNLEEQLLEKAAEIIATRGVEALSLRELGRALQVSRAAPYHYFEDKAALLARVGELGFRRLGERIVAAFDPTAPLPRQLRDGLRAYLRFACEHPNFFRLMFADVLRRDVDSDPNVDRDAAVEADLGSLAGEKGLRFSSLPALEAFRTLVDGVVAMQHQRVLRAMDPLLIVNVLWSYTHGVAALALGRNLKSHDAESVFDAGIDALLGSFATKNPQERR